MNSPFLKTLLASIDKQDSFVIDASISKNEYTPIDLSNENTSLETFNTSSSHAWATYINSYLKQKHKKVAFGGYLEKRGIYKRSAYFNTSNLESERNIHLGLDLWVTEGTAVLAAFNGKVHSFKDNTNFGDYGPTIILEHQLESRKYFTLYGHLSRESLNSIKLGAVINKGQTIGFLGTPEVNGDYAPHLHFQIILDLQDNVGDYPGVCALKDLEFYKTNTVNPEVILGL